MTDDEKDEIRARMRAKYPKWKVKLLELENGSYDVPEAVRDAAGQAIREYEHLESTVDEAAAELERVNLRVMALEAALTGLLEAANPYTDDELKAYHEAARHAELLLRGGEPEGTREKKNPENPDFGA